MSKRRKIEAQIDTDDNKADKIIAQLKGQSTTSSAADEKKTVRITLDIPKPLHAKIKAHTKARGQSIKGYLLFLASQDIEG